MGERQIIDRCQIFPHNINSRRPLNSRRNFTRSVKTGSNPWLSYKLLHATWIQGLHQGTWSSTDHPGAVKPSAWAEALGQMSRTLRNNRSLIFQGSTQEAYGLLCSRVKFAEKEQEQLDGVKAARGSLRNDTQRQCPDGHQS